MNAKTRKLVENATVRLTRLKGQGVVVPGGFILTATHCVGHETTGVMALDSHSHIEPVKIASGRIIQATPYIVEARSDIAVLGALDNQSCDEEAENYENQIAAIAPVPLFSGRLQVFKDVKVQVFTHFKTWVSGYATLCNAEGASIAVRFGELIKGGTSGSPVVTETGELLGVISQSTRGKRWSGSPMPFPKMALPVWILGKIRAAQSIQ